MFCLKDFGLLLFLIHEHPFIIIIIFKSMVLEFKIGNWSKSMDFNNLSCNTHRRKKLPIFFQNRVYTSHTLPNVCANFFFNMICEDYINLQTSMCMFIHLWSRKKNLIQFWKLEKFVNNLLIQTWAHHKFSTQIKVLTKATF